MKFLDNIIKKIVRDALTDSILEDIKSDIMNELKQTEDFKKSLNVYAASMTKSMSVYKAMERLDVVGVDINITLNYDVGVHKKYKKKHDTIGEFITFLKEHREWEKLKDPDVVSIRNFDLHVWYMYKGDRQLVAEYYLSGSASRIESAHVIAEEILAWSENHPQLMI